jgi:hypothetical protein
MTPGIFELISGVVVGVIIILAMVLGAMVIIGLLVHWLRK